MRPPLTIDELLIAGPPAAWRAAAFRVEADLCVVGSVRLRLVGPGPARGIVGWSVRGDRTTVTLHDAGFDLRREREGPTPGGIAFMSPGRGAITV